MPTPAEKKALLFIGAIALLGGAVRVWTAHASTAPQPQARPVAEEQSHQPSRSKSRRGRDSTRTRRRGRRPAASDSESAHSDTATIDLDRASIPQIVALGVVSAGIARMIVENRDTFGPFGSITELERVPYLPRAAIQKLAPRVTFSLLPRPPNAVMQPSRSPPAPQHRRRAKRREDSV